MANHSVLLIAFARAARFFQQIKNSLPCARSITVAEMRERRDKKGCICMRPNITAIGDPDRVTGSATRQYFGESCADAVERLTVVGQFEDFDGGEEFDRVGRRVARGQFGLMEVNEGPATEGGGAGNNELKKMLEESPPKNRVLEAASKKL
jgi:hypothetical protein